MNYTMNDNYENILDYLWEHHLLNAKQLNFLLNISNEIIIHSSFLNKLIEVMDNKIINYIFNHYSFNNQFIINLLSYYKNKKPLSDKDLKEKLNIEINKIKFDQTLYEKALHKENYKALNGLLNNDQRDDQNTLLDIFTAFQTIDSLDIIEKFIEKVKNNELRIRKKDLFLMNTVNIKEKRKTVKEMIQHNDIIGLKDYILKNNILLISLNDYYHDLLVDAIEDEVEISMIEFIITQYSNLNYVVHYTTDQNPRYKLFRPPLLSAIMKNNFKVADLLQYYGADINYKYHNENILFYLYFYFSQAMNSKNMKYLIYHHVDIELDKSYPYILDFLLNYYIFDHAFIIQLILLNRNNVSMSRKQFQKMILKEKRKLKLQRFSYNEMIINKNFKMLGRFLEYHHDDYEILEALNNCCSLSTYNNYCCYEYFDKELSIIYNERLDILKLLIMNQYIINKKIPSIYHYDDILIQACIEKNYSIIKYLLGCIDCSKTIKINKIKDCMSKIPFDIFKMLKNNYALYLNWK